MPKIYLYAEVLTHLRQLTLHASLETEKNEETKIDISSDKKIITVSHDGESSSLYLPTQISGTAKVTFPVDKKTEISARVQIDDLEQWKETDAAGIEAPWNASELSSETVMNCTQCGTTIVPTGTISAWKDLPNQHWADIMDLWFCHKPHEDHDGEGDTDDKAARSKGFSAQSKLVSEPGVGLVDLVSFAFHPNDCKVSKNTSHANENTLKPIPISCLHCQKQIGVFSTTDGLVRLDKSMLSVQSTKDAPFVSYPPTTFVSAQLLELIESTAVRKFVVHDQNSESSTTVPQEGKAEATQPATEDSDKSQNTNSTGVQPTVNHDPPNPSQPASTPNPSSSPSPPPQPKLLLWIFNPDVYYSSSLLPASHTTLLPHRALKIFYQLHPSNTHPQHDPLPLPTSTLDSLTTALQQSTALLPASARAFNTWSVGLLERYERHATAERVMEMNPLARRVQGPKGMDGKGRVTRWELPEGAGALFE